MERVSSSVGFQLFFCKQRILADTIRRLRDKRSSVTYSIKNSAANILTDENEILSRWREYFEGLLNPVKAQEVIYSGEEEIFTAAEVATATKR